MHDHPLTDFVLVIVEALAIVDAVVVGDDGGGSH